MADFFYRQASVGLPTGGRIRNNAYVTVSGGGFSLPVGASDMESTYNPNGTGRPAPILKEVKVALKGDAGSLRNAEVSFTCFDLPSFEAAEAALLVPGSEVDISYGYVGPEQPGGAGSHSFRVFDYSFKITKENYFDCSFKAVGKGGTYEQQEINSQGKFQPKEFITNYNGTNDKTKVGNLFDWIEYSIQLATNTTNSRGFDPGHGTSGPLKDGTGYFGVLKAPEEYNAATKMKGGWFSSDYLQYIQLGAVVNMINKYMLKSMKPQSYEMKFDPKFSNVQLKFPSGKVWSPDPVAMLFPHSGGAENKYSDGGWFPNSLMIDDFDNVPRMSGDQDSPSKILIQRDLLRGIQSSFDEEAKQSKNKEEEGEKTKGGMPLNRVMKKIFASIRECSGGAWDLYLDQDEDDAGTIWIVNRRCPGTGGGVTPLMLDPVGGSNGIRELSLSAKVPKDIQAKAFGGAPGSTSEEESAGNVIAEKDDEEQDDPPQSVSEQQTNARKGLADSDFDTASVSKAKAAVKALVNELTKEQRAATGQYNDGNDWSQTPFPLEFECTLDGVEGFKFGDTIATNYLPARYKKAGGGAKVVFTITEYEHKISGNDWTTTVKALARIR